MMSFISEFSMIFSVLYDCVMSHYTLCLSSKSRKVKVKTKIK